MSRRIRGITIELGANTTKMVSAFRDATKESSNLQKQLNDVNKLLKFDPKNVELLSQKQDLLSKKIEATNKVLKELDKIQKDMDAKGVDKASDQYMALQREIEDNKIALEHLQREAEETSKKLNQIAPGSNWGKLEQKIQGIQDKLTSAGQKMKDFGKEMSLKVTLPLVAAGTAAFNFASDLEDATGATEQVFKKSAGSVQEWAKNLESYYGIARSEALEYSNVMGTMLQGIGGLTEEEAAKTSSKLVELAGDLTAMFGGTTESAVQALTNALKGNNTMLDNYGMGVNDALVKTRALEMGLYDGTGQISLQARQAATLSLIMEQTADAQGQAAREAEGASGTTRAFTTELKNLATSMGEELLPIITPLIQKVVDVLKWFGDLDDSVKTIIVVVGILAAAIGPIVGLLGSIATMAGALNVAMLPTIGTIALIVAAITAAITIGVLLWKNWEIIKEKTMEIWGGIKDYISGVWESIKKGFSSAFEFIKNIFIFGFEALKSIVSTYIQIITLPIRFVWENTKDFLIETWETISSFASDIFNSIKEVIMTVVNFIGDFIAGIWNKIYDFTKKVFEGTREVVLSVWNKIKDIISNVAGGIFSSVKDVFGEVKDWIGTTFENVKTIVSEKWNAIKDAIMNPIRKAKDFVGDMIDKIKSFMKFDWKFPKLKLPHFSIDGKFSLMPPSVPKLKIDWYADGGIFNAPTIIPTLGGALGIGEYRTGGEVVAPLNKLQDMFNNAIKNHQQQVIVHNYFSVSGKQIATEIAPATDHQLGIIQGKKGR